MLGAQTWLSQSTPPPQLAPVMPLPQLPAVQLLVKQSPAIEQVSAKLQVPPQMPPQSRSVSVPFFTPSVQEVQMPPSQRLEAQSLLMEQIFVSTQVEPQTPPQSMSVSVPDLMPSVQVEQTAFSQRVLVQSAPAMQAWPPAQRAAQVAPPQSMPDSSWLEVTSEQVGARQMPTTLVTVWKRVLVFTRLRTAE